MLSKKYFYTKVVDFGTMNKTSTHSLYYDQHNFV